MNPYPWNADAVPQSPAYLSGVGKMMGRATAEPVAAQAITTRGIADGIIEVLPTPAALLDDELRVVAANSRLVAVLALDPALTVGRGLALLDGPQAREHLRRALSADGPAHAEFEVEVNSASPARQVFACRFAGLPDALPGMGRSLLTVQDVTAMPPVEPGPTPGRSRILAAATHDLRQPLQALTLLGSLLARRVNDPEVLPLLRRLEDTITAMSGMLNTLLDINRWNAETARAEPGNFAVGEVFDRLKNEFADKMRQRGLRWRVMSCRRMVHSDPRLLAQALRNMIDYALEHSHDGRMLLGARRHGQRVRIELWDSAFELADADAQAVHDALRPPKGRTPVLNPTLAPGLSMVRRIADLLGHRIDVGFKPGRGSVFSIDVPLVASAPAAPRQAPPSADPERITRGTVFVIDDDAGVRETMRDLLEATGWATEVFSSSEEFLKAERPGRAGCILVDALLPGMSGLELLRALKQQRHRLPAIMLTGAGDVRMAVDAMAAGALNFIEKPVRFEELLPSIERAFDLMADSSKMESWREQALERATSLTARQRQILEMVLAGKPSRNIAADLGVSRRTVENHRAVIMKKMGAASIPQLIRVGIAAS